MKWLHKFGIAIVLMGFLGTLIYGTRNITAQSTSEKPRPTPELFNTGKSIFEKQCAVCHGTRGAGDGKAAYLLYPKPRDFTRNEFRLISTNQMLATDEDLFKTLTRGMPGSSMPSWEHLSPEERWALAYYVRFLAEYPSFVKSGKIKENETEISWEILNEMIQKEIPSEARIEVPQELQADTAGIERGKELFLKACASCHGPLGKGDGQQMMKDSLGYPLKPRDLTAGIFKGESTSEALYHRIVAGLPGSPMPSYSKALTQEQIWDLIHYVRTLPEPGAEERSRLRRVKITASQSQRDLELDPLSEVWSNVKPVFVPLTPLWWRNDRVEGVEVRALYDQDQLMVKLSWQDQTQDLSTLRPQSFSDGASLQFSDEVDPPSFAMGYTASPVTFWHWKASWQEDLKGWRDIEAQYPNTGMDGYAAQKNYLLGTSFETRESKIMFHDSLYITAWGAGNPLSNPEHSEASEEGRAQGLGTLTHMRPNVEKVDAKGVWKEGQWQVVFSRSLSAQDKERLQFKPGTSLKIAFAIWDGNNQDRNGQKMVSIWNELNLE